MKPKLRNSDVEKQYRQATTCTGYQLRDEYTGGATDIQQVLVALVIAAIALAVTFLLHPVSFWLCIVLCYLLLAFIAVAWGGWAFEKQDIDLRSALLSIAATVLLYALFWLGALLLSYLPLPLLTDGITAIYHWQDGMPSWLVALILLFITGPCEEIFWRGFVQRGFTRDFGPVKGWLIAAVLYTIIHIVSLNPVLVLAALAGGLFWGFIYMRERNIVCCVICHSLWSVLVFLLLPLI